MKICPFSPFLVSLVFSVNAHLNTTITGRRDDNGNSVDSLIAMILFWQWMTNLCGKKFVHSLY